MALCADSNCLCPAEPGNGKRPSTARLSWNPPSYTQADTKHIPEVRTWVGAEREGWGRLGAQYYDNVQPKAKNSQAPSLGPGDPSHKSPRPLLLEEGCAREPENLLVIF